MSSAYIGCGDYAVHSPYAGLRATMTRAERAPCTRCHDARVPLFDEAAAAGVLLKQWDVLGVRETDVEAESEYRFEATGAVALLAKGLGVDAVAEYLSEQATSLGAAPSADRDRRAAEALIAWATE